MWPIAVVGKAELSVHKPEQKDGKRWQQEIQSRNNIHKDPEETVVTTQKYDVVKGQIFNLHSIGSVIKTKLKTRKGNQRNMCI